MGSVDKMHEIETNVSYYGQELLNDSRELAKKYNHNEVTQVHVLRVGLQNILSFINNLNSGKQFYDDESSFSMHNSIEEAVGDDVIRKPEKRNKIAPIIQKEIQILDEKLKTMPRNGEQNNKNAKLPFSKDFLNDIYSIYSQDNEEDMGGDGLVHDDTIMTAALFPNNDKIKKEHTVPFIFEMKDKIQLDKRPLSERTHLSFYDEKAKNVWKNLAIGTNMMILYDKDTTSSYIVNSFLDVFDKSKNGFGNINKDNTEIINFNDNGELDNSYIKKKLQDASKHKDKNYIMLMSVMDKDMDTLAIDGTNVNIFAKAPNNVKFVMIAEKDSYYRNNTNSDLKDFFSTVGEISVPLMNTIQAKKMFREQPKLTENLKKPFSTQAIDKCVEAANQLSGNYPEKAQKVMDLVASYYINKPNITQKDVQNYIKEATEIFKPVDNDNAVKIVFDTGIKLKDMVGSPATKKEAESIVNRIKDKSIGTKGFVIYSQDGSVGAGRKYTAQAIAGQTGSPYIEINAVDFGTKDVDLFGGGNLSPEASMKKLFGMVKTQAETNASKSAILFIENFEYFSFGENVSEYHEKAMSQLIREMNKAQEQGLNIIVMGSMSNPRYIDSATTKSFKFIDLIEVESPYRNPEARAEIIDYYIKKKGIKLDGDDAEKAKIKQHINMLMERACYIEILTLLDKAKNVAKERKHKNIDKSDFTEAFLQITSGRPSSVKEPEHRKKLVTSHECGHALNATVMSELAMKIGQPSHVGDQVSFITLDPRSDFGGMVVTSSQENSEMSFEHIFSDIVCDFGGTSCEKHFYNQDGSWGITCDMQMATYSASLAAGIMGQGKHFGKKSLQGMMFMSEEDKNNINKDVDVIMTNAQLVSEAITKTYESFISDFTKKYSPKVGTGECIVHKEEFLKQLNEWREKQSPEKLKELEILDKTILAVIEATKRGVKCKRAGE